ncbi:TetR family transcriptional regulator [Sinorhizobium arboris]|uniref:TetR family transcriptional regulator n=1 Tax=Sinorhizobium arboris TaxID=76745 RepID=UPI0003F7187F|nr:TetR family transcriptional regulator [Sinorhizobium arboris]
MDSPQKISRQAILNKALDIVEAQGIKALTQPRLAKACGIRQSHLTYYFPRKADLFVALLDASHGRAEKCRDASAAPLERMLAGLFFEPERLRFFLSILLEVGDDPALQPVLREHAEDLCKQIAGRLGRPHDDPDVRSFVDELRGVGLRVLMTAQSLENATEVLQAVAMRHGIDLSKAPAD